MATVKVKEVKLMKDGAMVTPVVLVDSVRNLNGTKYKDTIYTKEEINTKITALQKVIDEINKML